MKRINLTDKRLATLVGRGDYSRHALLELDCMGAPLPLRRLTLTIAVLLDTMCQYVSQKTLAHILRNLVAREPFIPLTFEDWEWDESGMNIRYPMVHKNSDGIILDAIPFAVMQNSAPYYPVFPVMLCNNENILTGRTLVRCIPGDPPWMPPAKWPELPGWQVQGTGSIVYLSGLPLLEKHYKTEYGFMPEIKGKSVKDFVTSLK